MIIKAILFDLDGTLLRMDQDRFINTYFSLLTKKLKNYGYDPDMLIKTLWKGTAAMVKNGGSESNEEAFWRCFSSIYGDKTFQDKEYFESYYENEFDLVREVSDDCSQAKITIDYVKQLGLISALATNPVFPKIATQKRMSWAGLAEEDFALYTTYENIGFCKPNPEYYREIARRLGISCEECIMVGNDVGEDMIASSTGMKVFLVTDYLINKENEDITKYPNGSLEDFRKFLSECVKESM